MPRSHLVSSISILLFGCLHAAELLEVEPQEIWAPSRNVRSTPVRYANPAGGDELTDDGGDLLGEREDGGRVRLEIPGRHTRERRRRGPDDDEAVLATTASRLGVAVL